MIIKGLAMAAIALIAQPVMAAEPGEEAFRALFTEMVETDSSGESGSCTPVIEKLVAQMKAAGFPEAAVTERLLQPAQRITSKLWPGVVVIPHLQPGASDAMTLKAAEIPTFGVSGLFRDPDNNGVHGLNERIRVQSVMEGRRFRYELVKAYADQKD